MYKLAELFEAAAAPGDYAKGYFARLAEVMTTLDTGALAAIVDALDQASRKGRMVYLIANGGSSAVASHFVNDLVAGGQVEGQPPFRLASLTDNGETVTAIANDAGFENLFLLQLQALMQPGDVVIAMSVSGNSENVIRGVKYANEHGALTIGLSGFDGGRLAKTCRLSLVVPTTRDEYGTVEDLFSILEHTITGYLTMKRGKRLHH